MINYKSDKIYIQIHIQQFLEVFNQLIITQSFMRKGEKRSESDKNTNYKNLIAQYYERDPHLSDIKDQIKTITPQIQILDELNDFEKKIDALIKTKRYDVQEMYMKPPQKLKRIFRLKIAKENVQGQQLLKIFGYIYPKKQETANCKFSSFFRQVSIVNEKDKVTLQTWKKPTSNFSERDGVIIKLPNVGQEAISAYLTLITNPPKFEIDPLLQKIVGIRTGTRVEVLDAFWLYVKTKKLQDVENKQVINSDDYIRQAFKTEKLTFATINHRVRQLLIPIDPIKITLNQGETEKIYDVIVEVEEKPNVDIVPFFSLKLNEEKNDHPFLSLVGKIKKCQNKFRDHAEKLRRHLYKRDIYKHFKSQKIQEIIEEQHKLLLQLKKSEPTEQYNRLEYILENEDELEKEIKHYFQQLSTNSIQN